VFLLEINDLDHENVNGLINEVGGSDVGIGVVKVMMLVLVQVLIVVVVLE
jgi:hypothetical protein